MDHFESIFSKLLEVDGYWVSRSFKIDLSKEDKRSIGKPSIPRPEIDIIARKCNDNKVYAIEVKSFLDSPGVKLKELDKTQEVPHGRYKMFTCINYRDIVFYQLRKQLVDNGMANEETEIILGLAAGKVHGESKGIREFLAQKGCEFWSPEDIKEKVGKLAKRGYENDPATIVAKILMR